MAYQYQPLKKGREIRLLEIKPPTDHTTSPFSLRIYDLSRLPRYEAISYTWGQPEFSSSITCDKEKLPITSNCSTMLRYLRLEATKVRRVWIDQICINQNDIPERNDQVLLMTKIYSRAGQVIAWIGECDEAENRCLDLIAQFRWTDTLRKVAKNYRSRWEGESHDGTSGDIGLDEVPEEVKPWFDKSGWARATLDVIICKPYFRRLWIVQEVTVARRVTLKCGACSLSMRHLYNVCNFLYDIALWGGPERNGVYITNLCKYRQSYAKYGTLDYDGLRRLLSTTKRCLVADNRDKIYALRGICKTLMKHTPLPDYSKSDVEIFIETAKASNIADHGRLTILNGLRSPSHGAGLPTWCPDYGQSDRTGFVMVRSSKRLLEKSKSPGRMPVIDGNRLIVRGRIVDSIAAISRQAIWRRDVACLPEAFKLWHSWFPFMESATSSYSGQEPMHKAFWSTLFNDTEDWLRPGSASNPREAERLVRYVEALHRSLMEHDTEGLQLGMSYWADSSLVLDIRHAMYHSSNMRACVTEDNFFGLVPENVEVGDLVVYLEGADKLHLLRPQDENRSVFIVVGSCFVYGLSKGEKYPMDDCEMREMVMV